MVILTSVKGSRGYSVEKREKNVQGKNSPSGLGQIPGVGWGGMKMESWIGMRDRGTGWQAKVLVLFSNATEWF